MRGLQLCGTWKPRRGYTPTQREIEDKRALCGKNIWYAPKIEVTELPTPEPADDEVLMEVGACGICGSDTCFLDTDEEGYLDYVGHTRLPVIFGHEFSGRVVAAGKRVTRFKEGDLVTAETMNWCGKCMPCRKGMFNQCENLEEIGFSLNGGFGQYLTAKEKYCLDINQFKEVYGSEEKALEAGALIEPTAVAYNGMFIRSGGFLPGSYVAVFGAGPIGLSAVQLAKAAGAAKVIVFEYSAPRLELAAKVGATDLCSLAHIASQGSTPADAMRELTEGKGVHMAVECTAFCNKNIPYIQQALAVGGKVVQIGHHAGRTEMFGQYFQKSGAALYGSNGSSGHGIWENVIRLIASGQIDPGKLVEKCFTLDEAAEGLKEAKNGTGGKYLITPNR